MLAPHVVSITEQAVISFGPSTPPEPAPPDNMVSHNVVPSPSGKPGMVTEKSLVQQATEHNSGPALNADRPDQLASEQPMSVDYSPPFPTSQSIFKT